MPEQQRPADQPQASATAAIATGGLCAWVQADHPNANVVVVNETSPSDTTESCLDWEKQAYPTASPDVQASLFAARDAIRHFLAGPLGRPVRHNSVVSGKETADVR
jgi:hypothetical protein